MPQELESFTPLQQWVVFVRAMEVRYAWEAAARGEAFRPLSADECLAVARLAAQFGRPGDVYEASAVIEPVTRQPVSLRP